MPLAMSRPWKHPRSGIHWLRKGVPEDLRELVGKREEKRSLQTRDPLQAKRRHAEALAEIEVRWANLRAGPKAITERESAPARPLRYMTDGCDSTWKSKPADSVECGSGDRLFAPPRLLSYDISDPEFERSMDQDSLRISSMEKWCFEIADECLATQGARADTADRHVSSRAPWRRRCNAQA